jgi:hypothetical protein
MVKEKTVNFKLTSCLMLEWCTEEQKRKQGDMVKRALKQSCKRAVSKGVKRRAEKETVKDSEKDTTGEISVNLSYVTEAERIARKETLKCGQRRA